MASDKNLRVYVGNLAWGVKEDALEEHMTQAGSVTKVTIFKYDNGLSKGCAIVTYAQREQAFNAIQTLNDTELNERKIFVREDKEDVEGPPSLSQGERRGRFERGRRPFRGRFRPRYDDGRRGDNRSSYNSRRGGNYASRQPRGKYEVTVNNLSYNTTWKELKDFFREVAPVTRADVIPTDNGERNGVVIFSRQEDAVDAVAKLNNKELQGSKLTVSMLQA